MCHFWLYHGNTRIDCYHFALRNNHFRVRTQAHLCIAVVAIAFLRRRTKESEGVWSNGSGKSTLDVQNTWLRWPSSYLLTVRQFIAVILLDAQPWSAGTLKLGAVAPKSGLAAAASSAGMTVREL